MEHHDDKRGGGHGENPFFYGDLPGKDVHETMMFVVHLMEHQMECCKYMRKAFDNGTHGRADGASIATELGHPTNREK
jgi:hypothetical protein